MSHRFCVLICTLAVFLVSGCAGLAPRDPSTTSLIFGYVDMTDAPQRSGMDDIELMRAVPQKKPVTVSGKVDYNNGISMKMRPGNFWAYNLLPGTYQIAEIAGARPGVSMGAPVTYYLHFSQHQKNASTMTIDKPGLHFMGSFKVKGTEDGKFEMVKVNKPTEKEVLERVLLRNRMSYWEPIIKQRLAELGK